LHFVDSWKNIHVLVMHAGSDGRQIQLRTNIFPIRMPQQYCLYQYHVNFNPEVPSTAIRKAMIAENREHFGQFYMFDGMQLFLQARLENDVSLCDLRSYLIVSVCLECV